MKEIILTRGMVALVDDEDYDWINQWKWSFGASGYALRKEPNPVLGHLHRKTLYMYKVLMNSPEGMHVDHINGNKLDNRRCNLRVVTLQDNSKNRLVSKNNVTGYKGVHYCNKYQRYVARIGVNGFRKYLGHYRTAKEAAKAYNDAALKYHGEYAKFNNILEV